jgi:hypothetical protein
MTTMRTSALPSPSYKRVTASASVAVAGEINSGGVGVMRERTIRT